MAYTRGATYNRNIFLLADNWCFTQGGFQAGRKGEEKVSFCSHAITTIFELF